MEKSQIKKMWIADRGDGTYANPILYTDYSDPDVIRVGEDFFMVCSSFCNTPVVPVLHSKDLVNWKVVSYAMDRLPFAHYDKPMHGKGAWAPAIRYHEGIYYIFIPLPDEGIFMVKSQNPFEGWEAPVCVREGAGWIDPCPFWDEDGNAYMVSAFAKSRMGFNSVLNLAPMKPDATGLLEDGKIVFDGNETQPTIEGPKLYKRNGYYYIFAPAGGVPTGWQTVLRSKDIWGPYEERKVLHQGSTIINGPHQGAWVDAADGSDWFLHFQDVGNAGRIIHLQPMRWENDWPIIGENVDDTGCGEPVLCHAKPGGSGCDVNKQGEEKSDEAPVESQELVYAPEDSDFFESTDLGLQWQWNANYKEEWYSLDGKCLTLYAQPVTADTKLCDVSNLLLQKWPAPEFMVTARVDLSGMEEGEECGLVSLGGVYSGWAVTKLFGKKLFLQRTGQWVPDDAMAEGKAVRKDKETAIAKAESDILYLRMKVEKEEFVSFYYSYDGRDWTAAGEVIKATPGRWVGVKIGLYALHKCKGKAGFMKVDHFVFEEAR